MKKEKALKDLGPMPKFGMIDIDDLCINKKYQREISKDGDALIGRIVRDFDWRRFTPVTVTPATENTRKYFVLDGQHRVNAALKIPLITELPCWVIDAPEIAEQAEAFIGLNKNRIKMMPINIFHAELAAGDPLAERVARCCAKAGVLIARKHMSTFSLKENETLAVSALKRTAQKYGPSVVTDALKIIREHVDGINTLRASTIMVISKIIHQGDATEGFDLDRFKSVLEGRDVDTWIELARSYHRNFGGGLQNAMRAAMIKNYNARGKRGRLRE